MLLPQTRHLEAFMAVAEARSFRLAADRIGLSQPALSQNIAALEAHLDTMLFLRSTRSVRLTAEGAELHRHLSRIMPALHTAMDRTRTLGTDGGVVLRIGLLASAAVKYLPEALTLFRERFPQIAVFARDDTAEGLFDAVHGGDLDLAVSSFLPHSHRDVDFQLLIEDPFMAVLRHDHPLAAQSEVTWSDLLAYDFIGANLGSGTRFETDAAMRAIGRTPRTVMNFNHYSAVAGMVEAQMGVSALPQMNCPPPDHPLLCARPLIAPRVTRDLGLLTNSEDGHQSQPLRHLRDCLLQVAGHA